MDEFLSLLKEMDVKDTSLSDDNSVNEETDKKIKFFCDIEYFFDYVFCIDVTSDMTSLLKTIKEVCANLYNRNKDFFSNYSSNKKLDSLRVKIIAFRDVYWDEKYWIETSDFFILPSQTNELLAYLNTLEAKGGGDEPESSLEALALAMRADWVKINDLSTQRARHVIVLCTDSASHSFEESKSLELDHYPLGMPNSYKELLMMWNGSQPLDRSTEESFYMDKSAKRLFIFAPEECYPWYDISEDFEYMCLVPVERGSGFSDVSSDVMLEVLFNTIY